MAWQAAASVAAAGVAFAATTAITPSSLTTLTGGTAVPAATCVLTAAADTYADEASSLSNFGTSTALHVRSGATLLLLPANKRAFVRFDLSPCGIAANARVTSAKMKLYLSAAPSVSRTYHAHRIDSAWGETSLTWSQQPSVNAVATASVSTGTLADVLLEWDVVTDVQSFVAGTATNDGWRISDALESDTGEAQFDSREHSTATRRPSLHVTYYP